MTTTNRQINTGFNPAESKMKLKVLNSGHILGRKVEAGEVIEVTKSEARRLMATDKKMFKVSLD